MNVVYFSIACALNSFSLDDFNTVKFVILCCLCMQIT